MAIQTNGERPMSQPAEADVADYKAPPLAEVEVDTIDGGGQIHPIAITARR